MVWDNGSKYQHYKTEQELDKVNEQVLMIITNTVSIISSTCMVCTHTNFATVIRKTSETAVLETCEGLIKHDSEVIGEAKNNYSSSIWHGWWVLETFITRTCILRVCANCQMSILWKKRLLWSLMKGWSNVTVRWLQRQKVTIHHQYDMIDKFW